MSTERGGGNSRTFSGSFFSTVTNFKALADRIFFKTCKGRIQYRNERPSNLTSNASRAEGRYHIPPPLAFTPPSPIFPPSSLLPSSCPVALPPPFSLFPLPLFSSFHRPPLPLLPCPNPPPPPPPRLSSHLGICVGPKQSKGDLPVGWSPGSFQAVAHQPVIVVLGATTKNTTKQNSNTQTLDKYRAPSSQNTLI